MSKKIYAFIIGIFLIVTSINAQVAISFEGGTVNSGENIEIDVSVASFTNLLSMQYSINWDSTVLKFVSVGNLNSNINGFTVDGSLNFPGPEPSNWPGGQFSVSWSEPLLETVTIDDGVLFTITFEGIGNDCDTTSIIVSDSPRTIEVVNGDFEEIELSSTPSIVQIEGADCEGSGGEDDVIFTIPTVTVEAGGDICIPVTVQNYIGVAGFQFPISWDPTILELTGTNVPANSFGSIAFNDNNEGEIDVLYTNQLGELDTLDDNFVLFEVCFKAIGNAGDVSDVTFTSNIGFTIGVFDVSYQLIDGKITLNDGPVQTLTFVASDETVTEGNQVCVDFTALNFNDIAAFQAHISWDGSILNYLDIQSTNLSGLSPGNFSYDAGNVELSVTWNSPSASGIDFADNEVMFKVCFDEVDCGGDPTNKTSEVGVDDDDYLAAWAGDIDNTIEVDVAIVTGVVTVQCESGTCVVANMDHPSCNGEASGNIVLDLTDVPAGCTCVWTKSGVQVGATLVTPDCNLLGVTAGVYEVVITCGNDEFCTGTVTLIDPPAIQITNTITNISCDTEGKIEINVTGGTGSYEYEWSNDLTGNEVVTVGEAGEYCVTITDDNNCTYDECFSVGLDIETLSVNLTVTQISCNGESDGVLEVVVEGGCPNYTYLWSNAKTTATISGLVAGEYAVTVSDGQIPSKIATASMTIVEPELLTATYEVIVENGTSSIDVTVEGGTMPYNYQWDDGDGSGPTTEDRIGLEEGIYKLTITDANDCVYSGIEVPIGNSAKFEVKFEDVSSDFGGYDISCFGNCDAVVVYTISGSEFPITVELKVGSDTKSTSITSIGSYTFESVCAGESLTLIATDSNGEVVTSDEFDIVQPTQLEIDTDSGCADPGVGGSGYIQLTVTGGVEEYTYDWDKLSGEASQINVEDGIHNVIVTDENGCQVMSNINVFCAGVPSICFIAREVITPNGDGKNDQFIIECASNYANTLTMYNRTGEEVYKVVNYDNTWEGDDLREGSYMWIFIADLGNGNSKVIKGTMAILR